MWWYVLVVLGLLNSVEFVNSHNLSESEALAFEVPEVIKKDFPYYLYGFDEDEAPIWIWELGKWDVRKYVEEGGELFHAMDVYVDQMFLTMRESGLNTTGKKYVSICDLDQFNIRQAGHFKTVQFILSKFVTLEKIIRDGNQKQGFIVNANAVFLGLWRIGKPLLGSLSDVVEVFGTNKDIWIPKLLKALPRDQLPEWYGGPANHKPLKVLG